MSIKKVPEQSGHVMTMLFENASYALNAFLYFHKYMPEHLREGLDKRFLQQLNSCTIDESPMANFYSADVKESITADCIAEQCLEPLGVQNRLGVMLTTCHSVVVDPAENNKPIRTYFALKLPYFFLDTEGYAPYQCNPKLHINVQKPKTHYFWQKNKDLYLISKATEEFLKGPDLVNLIHDEDISKEKGIILKGHHNLSDYFGLINKTECQMEKSWDGRNLKASSLKRALKVA